MSTFVLVHGAWHGAWCWNKLTPLLEKTGNKVITITLPYHGEDTRSVRRATIKKYAKSVEKLILQESDPVTLVGHSLGGLTITQVAEDIPNRISKLVYLAAYVPINCSSLKLNLMGSKRILFFRFKYDLFHISFTVWPKKIKDTFYNTCSEEDAEDAISRLVPEPLNPAMQKVKVTDARYGSVRKYYVKTTQDHIIPPKLQTKMTGLTNFEKIVEMNTDHSPFLSNPQGLADLLTSL